MIDRGVVGDKIHEDFYAALVSLFDELFKIGDGAESRVDGIVIGDVITEIFHRRNVNWRDPNSVDAERVFGAVV